MRGCVSLPSNLPPAICNPSMILVLSLAVVAIAAYARVREGLLTALTLLINVLLSGLVAFNYFEPVAAELHKAFKGSFLDGYEDALALFALFAAPLALLRVVCNNLAPAELDLPALPQQIASAAVGGLTGYLLAGFLVCAMQTLPWGERFLGFDATVEPQGSAIRRVMPPDRVWLALMHRAGAGPFSNEGATTFDPDGTFELRYARQRRVKDQ
jgi:hypothetical protein